MKELNTSKNTAVKWRKRFCKDRLDGLKDEQRPGKPRTHGAEVRLKIATDACRPPETITHWSTRELAQRLSEQGIIELWFSIYGRKIIKRGVFSSKEDLAAKTLEFIELYNKNAEPFRWTHTGDPLTI